VFFSADGRALPERRPVIGGRVWLPPRAESGSIRTPGATWKKRRAYMPVKVPQEHPADGVADEMVILPLQADDYRSSHNDAEPPPPRMIALAAFQQSDVVRVQAVAVAAGTAVKFLP
jgi:hypothetical protein